MSDNSNDFFSVYSNDVAEWCKALRINDSDFMLVAFAWSHDKEFHFSRMFT